LEDAEDAIEKKDAMAREGDHNINAFAVKGIKNFPNY